MPRRRRTRGGNRYLNAAKEGLIQGLRNTPRAVANQFVNTFSNRASAYSTPNSIISMRGSNINDELANLNREFVKEASTKLRPYTAALRQTFKNKATSARQYTYSLPKVFNSRKVNLKRYANKIAQKLVPYTMPVQNNLSYNYQQPNIELQ